MENPSCIDRRSLVRSGGLLMGSALMASAQPLLPQKHEEVEVSPNEDLMREHGVLTRVLLVYEEVLDRLENGRDFPREALSQSADIVSRFIHGYHEKLEEDHLFPRLEKAGRLTDLVGTLRSQHDRGRRATAEISHLAKTAPKDPGDRNRVIRLLKGFSRMYVPHAAREDTVLFPGFRSLVSPNEFDSLGEEFEEKEHELFGDDGFGKIVAEVVKIETMLGIHDLSRYTLEL